MENKTISILGVPYTIEEAGLGQDPRMEIRDGYTDPSVKRIRVSDLEREEGAEDRVEDLEWFRRQVTRHEIIHAFITESGAGDADWHTEDMVNWLAYMAPALHTAFVAAACECGATTLATETGPAVEG